MRVLRATFTGRAEPSLRALFEDVLVGLPLQDADAAAHVVFAMVAGTEIASALEEARARGGGAPVVVVLPFDDDAMIDRARRLGATACFALGAPLDELRQAIAHALAEPRAASA